MGNNQNETPRVRCPKCGSTDLEVVSDVKGKGASGLKICLCGCLLYTSDAADD